MQQRVCLPGSPPIEHYYHNHTPRTNIHSPLKICRENVLFNLLRNARVNPILSAQAFLFVNFDFNRTPLAPPGTRVVVHVKPRPRHRSTGAFMVLMGGTLVLPTIITVVFNATYRLLERSDTPTQFNFSHMRLNFQQYQHWTILNRLQMIFFIFFVITSKPFRIEKEVICFCKDGVSRILR